MLNLQSLPGYTTGGTVHFIADNQVGFTTNPPGGRSTRYASDLAKGFDIPIVHVNADDVEACLAAITFAYDYRRAYRRDVMVHLIGYRRFGHNEADEPAYTQPLMYLKIRSTRTVRELFADATGRRGSDPSPKRPKRRPKRCTDAIADAHKRVKEHLAAELDDLTHEQVIEEPDDAMMRTAVSGRQLAALNDQLLTFPKHFTPNAKLVRQMERRKSAILEGAIDWGTAEALAFASLITQGHPIRLTGQDTVRGTFSHRHLAFHDERNGEVYIPMQHLTDAQATFEVLNSPLSEVGCLGFEYGYSAADPETLVIWEAQYGDFFNNAEMIVDQFVSSARAKWGQHSRLTMLLPHGYEGSGPEHSSARIERFLQLCANDNMRLANCTTPAQYFHLLRSQGLLNDPRPLVIFTPKSLLRLKESTSKLADLSTGRFQAVIDDPTGARTSRGGALAAALLGPDLLRADPVAATRGRHRRRHRARRATLPAARRRNPRAGGLVSEARASVLGSGGAAEHGRVGEPRARARSGTTRRTSSGTTSAGRAAPVPPRDTRAHTNSSRNASSPTHSPRHSAAEHAASLAGRARRPPRPPA